MSVGRRWRALLAAGVAAGCLPGLVACGPAGPEQPPPEPTAPLATPATSAPPAPPATSATPVPSSPSAASPSASLSGHTLRELGFENGPLDEFSVPSDAVVSTGVDQPNVVTIVLSRPSPQTVEDYLRATLPGEGFTIGARGGAAAGGAMTFEGNGWTGGFTGTATTSAIVLRPT